MKTELRPQKKISGCPAIPGDKSISHRGLIFSALAKGRSEVLHILESADVQSTARVLRQLGVEIKKQGALTIVESGGAKAFRSPDQILDCGNSGTTMRLLMGVLSALPQSQAEMTGDESLVKRPMKRVAQPLEQMGAKFELTRNDYAPLKVWGQKLRAVDFELKIASAQIKTAVMLAALFAEGTSRIHGEIHSRDHTERLLGHFGVQVQSNSGEVLVKGEQKFEPARLKVPGDPSTAAFWLAGATLLPGSHIELQNISLNPTRIGFIRVLQRMGAQIKIDVTETDPEPVGTIEVSYAPLKGVVVSASEVPSLIDELPLLAVLATQAHGVTQVSGAEELRVKETDRIEAVAKNLRAMGAKIETKHDGFIIEGPQKLKGTSIESFHDHRIAMGFSIASLVSEGSTVIQNSECVAISYPEFFSTLHELTHS
jgi:3-phosphoshikimate 1-carboxyvinyltransferase